MNIEHVNTISGLCSGLGAKPPDDKLSEETREKFAEVRPQGPPSSRRPGWAPARTAAIQHVSPHWPDTLTGAQWMLQDLLTGDFHPMYVASHFFTAEDTKGRGMNKIGALMYHLKFLKSLDIMNQFNLNPILHHLHSAEKYNVQVLCWTILNKIRNKFALL